MANNRPPSAAKTIKDNWKMVLGEPQFYVSGKVVDDFIEDQYHIYLERLAELIHRHGSISVLPTTPKADVYNSHHKIQECFNDIKSCILEYREGK